jgi:hypothetical protein
VHQGSSSSGKIEKVSHSSPADKKVGSKKVGAWDSVPQTTIADPDTSEFDGPWVAPGVKEVDWVEEDLKSDDDSDEDTGENWVSYGESDSDEEDDDDDDDDDGEEEDEDDDDSDESSSKSKSSKTIGKDGIVIGGAPGGVGAGDSSGGGILKPVTTGMYCPCIGNQQKKFDGLTIDAPDTFWSRNSEFVRRVYSDDFDDKTQSLPDVMRPHVQWGKAQSVI